MLQLENILLNDIYTFVFHKSRETLDSIKSFTDHLSDTPKLQFVTFKLTICLNFCDEA